MPGEREARSEATKGEGKENRPGIVLLGNMNVGKTTLFSRISGREARSMNMAGNTVEITAGAVRGMNKDIFDVPGVWSIFSANEEERAARDILLPQKTDNDMQGIILVADVKNMKRSMALALQYAEYGLPMLLDINMIDEASPYGIDIDYHELSEILGIDVCPTIARDGIGVSKMISRLGEMKVPHKLIEYPDWVEEFLEIVTKLFRGGAEISPRVLGILLLAGDKGAEEYVDGRFGFGMLAQLKSLVQEYLADKPQSFRILLTNLYHKRAEQIVNQVQQVTPPPKSPFLEKLGSWCAELPTGIPIAMSILYLLYLFVGTFGATFLVDTINGTLFEGFLIPMTTELVAPIPSQFVKDMIVDPDFGILPTGVFLALGLVMPVLFCFYIAFGLLEDSGYLPRLSLLLDKLFQRMGLNGKGVIPLVMGFSCITMAILTTRMLDTKKEKNIATFLLLLGMPCAPLLAVMFIILGKMPISASITVFGLIFLQILMAGILANKILPGERTPLFMVLPPMRVPKLLQNIKMSASKTYFFMKEAVPVFIFASFIVFLFERIGGLALLERVASPVIDDFMGLPEKSIQVFIKTIIRREAGATEIEHLSNNYDNVQLVVNLLVMTFLTPCINAIIVLFKERGTKAGLSIISAVMIYAILIGSIVNHTCRFFGVTFS